MEHAASYTATMLRWCYSVYLGVPKSSTSGVFPELQYDACNFNREFHIISVAVPESA